MISNDTRSRILRLHLGEQWLVGTIARELGLHHSTVRRVVVQAGSPEVLASQRPSKVDPYMPFIVETLRTHPDLRASRLHAMVKERGYDGKPDHFRSVVARLRPRRQVEAFLRLRTLPGEQAQVDWAHFGQLRVGRAVRKLYGFVVVLSWSRRIFLRFGHDIGMAGFVRGHVEAFEAFGGVPRVLLYDNLKSAVLERVGDAIRFHPTLLELAGHYRFEPRPVAVARGNEKGRVERAIRYIRDGFFAARAFSDLADLNAQADAWCQDLASDRKCPEDPTLTVKAAFELEKPRLRTLPGEPFWSQERKEVTVGKTPYVRFDLNDYSVPAGLVHRQLVVVATAERVRVLDGQTVVADHARSFDQGQQVEDPEHIRKLEQAKAGAREHRAQDRLLTAVPSVREMLTSLAERGDNRGTSVAALVRLLDHYGGGEVEAAVQHVLAKGVPHPSAVRQTLEHRRHQRGLPPPVAVTLPRDARLRDLQVRPHALGDYDGLGRKEDDHE